MAAAESCMQVFIRGKCQQGESPAQSPLKLGNTKPLNGAHPGKEILFIDWFDILTIYLTRPIVSLKVSRHVQ